MNLRIQSGLSVWNRGSALVLISILGGGLLSCSPDTPDAFLPPVYHSEKVEQDTTQVYEPSVDILFVVDNSGSMSAHQRNLAANVAKFTSTFTKSSVLDYNIGVVTTDMHGSSWNKTACCGQLVGAVRVVNKSTPGADMVLASNFDVGLNGSANEASFEPVMAALSIPNLTTWNAGFYRSNASLVVIFLTDAEDQSRGIDAPGLYQFLLNLKNGNVRKVLSYGVIVPTQDTLDCERDEGRPPLRIEGFLSLVHNSQNGKSNIMNICDPDYGSRLADMAKDIVENVGSTIYLDLPPDIRSIRVTYGNMLLPQDFEHGWSFDPKKNAIVLGSKIDWAAQPFGSRVKVAYSSAKFE